MAQPRQHAPLFFKELQRLLTQASPDGFKRDKAPGDSVIGFVHYPHSALSDGRVFNFVSASNHKRALRLAFHMHSSAYLGAGLQPSTYARYGIVTQDTRIRTRFATVLVLLICKAFHGTLAVPAILLRFCCEKRCK